VGSWDVGATIRFFDTNKDGMIGEIAENNGVDFISIRMLGYITKGVDDTTSEEILTWAPSYENYTYRSTTTGTQLIVDVEVSNEWIDFMNKTYPLALQRLKEICER